MKNALLLFCILFIRTCFAQAPVAWTGSISTDWSMASNWSPAAVPTSSNTVVIGSATNQPVLAGNTTIAGLTLNAGAVLNLGTYLLTVSGTTTSTNAQVTNGEISGASLTATSSTFGAKTSFTGAFLQIRNSTFNAKAELTQTGASQSFSYGNTFNSPVEICNNGTAAFNFGYTNADVFNDSLKASVKGTHNLVLAHSSIGNAFNGHCSFTKDIGATSWGVLVGGSNTGATFTGGVKIRSLAGTSHTQQGIAFTNCTFASTSSLGVDDNNFIRGTLLMAKCTLNIAVNITLQEQTRLELSSGTVFNSTSSFVAPALVLSSFSNNAPLSITKTGGTTDLNNGPFTSNDLLTIRNSGTGYLYIGNGSVGHQFNQTLMLENTGAGSLVLALNEPNTALSGDLIIRTTAGQLRAGTTGVVNKPTLSGDLRVRILGGIGILAGTKLAAGKRFISDTLSGGSFGLSDVIQLGSQASNLTGTGTARISFSGGCDFGGDFTAVAPSFYFTNSIFRGNLSITKTGNINDQCEGNLTIYGNTLFKNTCSSINRGLEVCYGYRSMIYHGDVTFENEGTGWLYPGYAGTHYAKSNVIFSGTNYLAWDRCHKLILNGTGNQEIKRTNTLPYTFLYLEINKPSGEVLISMPFSVNTNLNLVSGIIKTNETNLLLLNTGTTVTGGSNLSYIDGPISKPGTSAFVFPIGANGVYAPLAINATSSSTTFIAKYIGQDPNPTYNRSLKESSLGFINLCGYWSLNRSTGTGNTNVQLNWVNSTCFNSDPINTKITFWDGSLWKDIGNGAYSGNSTTGNVTSSSTVSTFPRILNLSGVCSTSDDIALVESSCSGYLACYVATTGCINYKFYLNNVLVQDGNSNQYSTNIINLNDEIKVVATTPFYCIKTPAPVYSTLQSEVDLGSDLFICPGGPSITLSAPSGYDTYTWSTSETTSTITVASPGVYSVVLTLGARNTTDEIEVFLADAPLVNLGPDISICQGQNITLNAGDGFETYLWGNSQTTSSIVVNSGGIYSVTVTNEHGCAASDQLSVTTYTSNMLMSE